MLPLSALNAASLPVAAQTYALLGFTVFPCTPNDKTPLVSWTEQATDNPAVIERWWAQWPEANIGLPMGNGRHALDLDRGRGGDGWASYRALGGPQDPSWPAQKTPGGGLHILFSAGLELSNFTHRGPAGGMDMRTDRGYILGGPSRVNGVPYRWRDGDPAAPLPPSLRDALVSYSTAAAERSLEAFPMVDPADLPEDQVERLIDGLGASHARFLREGVSETGDASRDAYHACLRAFSSGWSLADMAAIGPRTYLAAFGTESPHHAGNPWSWAWRYTVRAAWVDSGRGKKEAPGGTGLSSDLGGLHDDPEGIIEEAGRTVPEVHELLKTKARELGEWNEDGAFALLEEALGAGLLPSRLEMLLQGIKRATAIPLGVLRARLRELEQEALRRRAGTAPEALPEVYIRAQGKYFDQRSRLLITQDALITARAERQGGNITASRRDWLEGVSGATPTVEDLTWDPGQPGGVMEGELGVRYYNTYRGSLVQPVEGDVRPWLALLDRLGLEEGESAKQHLLDYYAWVYQHPGTKIQHGVLLGSSAHGIGKDSWLIPIWKALGEHNVQVIGAEELLGGFTDYLKGTKMLQVNEILLADHKDKSMVNEKLKLMLASPPNWLRINEKNLRPYNIPNVVQLTGCTNHRYCLAPEPGERRIAAFWCRAQAPETEEAKRDTARWFSAYHEWVAKGGAERIAWFLQERDLSHFNPAARPPTTAWLDDMISYQRDPLEVWLIEQINNRQGVFEAPIVTLEGIMSHAATGVGSHLIQGHLTQRRLCQALTAVGCRVKRYWDGAGVYKRGWQIREHPSFTPGADTSKIGVVVRAEGRFREQGYAPPKHLREGLEF